jgi:hypothetical protein
MTVSERDAVTGLLEQVAAHTSRISTAIDHVHGAVLEGVSGRPHGSVGQVPDLQDSVCATLNELIRTGSPVYGLGFIADPLLASGHSDPQWWYRAERGRDLRRLVVGTDPGRLDFYDYSETPWYLTTLNDDSLHVTSPYVDYCGTNSYIVTLSRRVQVDGSLLGICGADIVVGELQSCLQEQLLTLARPSFVIDDDGAVIATNSAQFLGANRSLELDHEREYRVPGLPWRVVVPKSRRSRQTTGTRKTLDI